MNSPLSKKQAMKELLRCGKDPSYFINTYAKITHPQRGLIPFKLYDFQKEAIDNFQSNRFNIILKARQLGLSTITAAYVAWMMMFHREKNVLVIATKFSTAANLVKKVKAIIKHLPEWVSIARVEIDNRTSFQLSNGSQIKASSTSGDAGRSEALSLLVVDEAAHIDSLEELWVGLYPTLSTGGRCIALSTPNGVGNWFHKTYIEATQLENDFATMVLPWDVHPDRDSEWFAKETKNMSRREIAQELECNFNMSGETVFHPEDLGRISESLRDPEYRTGFDRNMWMWERAIPGENYLVSADVARGDGADYSVFLVFKVSTMEVVSEYRGKLTPDIFSKILFDVATEYNNALLVVENNSVGFSVLDKLIEMDYQNIYYSIKSTHEYVEQYLGEHQSNAVAGFTMSSKTRPIIISKLEEFIRNKLITLYSKRMFDEMRTFIWNNGRPEAMRSYNDDLIMACAIGCWVRDTALTESKKSVEYRKAFLDTMTKSSTMLDTTVRGMTGHNKGADSLSERAREHKRNVEQFSWLFKG